jgi:hypothetical protein
VLPGLPQLVAAAAGGLAIAIGLVAVLSGALLGAALAAGGALLVWWSILKPR